MPRAIRLPGREEASHRVASRQQANGSEQTTTALSTGAIVGIAIGGSVIIFAALAFFTIRVLRTRSMKKRNRKRRSLSDDNDDVIEIPRVFAEAYNLRLVKAPTIEFRTNPNPNLQISGPNETNVEPLHPNLVPPLGAFQALTLRDSIPQIRWVSQQTQSTAQGFWVMYGGNLQQGSYQEIGGFVTHVPVEPRRVLTRSSSTQNALARVSSSRGSVSDAHLSSILRSTSLRLRTKSRSTGTLNRVSGEPPAAKAPSPPVDRRTESRERLIEEVDITDIGSIDSYATDTDCSTPSPLKDEPKRLKREESSVSLSSLNGKDSLTEAHELSAPLQLTSPSKRARTDNYLGAAEGRRSADNGVQIYEDGQASTCTETPQLKRKLVREDSSDDPFVFDSAYKFDAESPFTKKLYTMASKQNSQHVKPFVFGTSQAFQYPLRPVSGNGRSPNRASPTKGMENGQEDMNMFRWSTMNSIAPLTSPGKRPRGVKGKGHRRQKTIRLSHLPRPISVSVVLEEPEPEGDGAIKVPTAAPAGNLAAGAATTTTSAVAVATEDQNNDDQGYKESQCSGAVEIPQPSGIKLVAPQWITNAPLSAICQDTTQMLAPPEVPTQGQGQAQAYGMQKQRPSSFFISPSASMLSMSSRGSHESYSATMSVYDMYSSPHGGRHSRMSYGGGPSPTESPRRTHDRAQTSTDIPQVYADRPSPQRAATVPVSIFNYSQSAPSQTTYANSAGWGSAPITIPAAHHGGPRPAPGAVGQFAGFPAKTQTLLSPFQVTKLHGPRPQPIHAPSGSVAASIAQLRRMNSAISGYSDTSNVSLDSYKRESAGKASSRSAKTRSTGSINYLSIGINKSPSPDAKRPTPSFRSSTGSGRSDHIRASVETFAPPVSPRRSPLPSPSIANSPRSPSPLRHSLPPAASAESLNRAISGTYNRSPSPVRARPMRNSLVSTEDCMACNNPLPSLRLDSGPVSDLAARFHEHCFRCAMCGIPLAECGGHVVEKRPYCADHYWEVLGGMFRGGHNKPPMPSFSSSRGRSRAVSRDGSPVRATSGVKVGNGNGSGAASAMNNFSRSLSPPRQTMSPLEPPRSVRSFAPSLQALSPLRVPFKTRGMQSERAATRESGSQVDFSGINRESLYDTDGFLKSDSANGSVRNSGLSGFSRMTAGTNGTVESEGGLIDLYAVGTAV
jgi:hypothetical protein